MAIVKKTDFILGDLTGSLGPVVISNVRNTKVVKMKPAIDRTKRRRKKKGVIKPNQNLKLGLVSSIISELKAMTDIGFGKRKLAAFPAAVQYNLDHAITGTSPNFIINYPELMISLGNREMAWSSSISCDDSYTISVGWEIPATAKLKEIGKDNSYIVLYDETQQKAFKSWGYTPRSALSYSLTIGKHCAGHVIHAYIFFESQDKKYLSKSDYVGSIVLP